MPTASAHVSIALFLTSLSPSNHPLSLPGFQFWKPQVFIQTLQQFPFFFFSFGWVDFVHICSPYPLLSLCGLFCFVAMAINIFSENSPRISFSHDFCQADVEPIENCKSRNPELSILENSDFDFCVSSSCFEHESSSADELFSNGIILPVKIQERTVPPRSVSSLPPLPSPSTNTESLKKESSKGTQLSSVESQEKLQSSSSKSFWPFKRSSSLNCDNVHRRSLMCSLPLLSRSNSTGSVPNSKRASKQNSQKQPSMAKSSSSSSSSSATPYTNFYTYPVSKKPHLKKNFGGSYGNGVWISPVINVPPAYIPKGTTNLFGLFRNGKEKKSRKWL